MGLQNTGSQIRYINIVYGKFALRCNPDTPGAITRRNKIMQEVHELHYDTLSGKLTDVQIHDGEYGKDWVFNIYDGEGTYRLQIPQNIGSAIGILARLQVINYAKDVSIKIYYIDEKTHLVVYQDGKKLQSAYTKDNPNGLPQLEQIQQNGKTVWDASKRNAYFENMIDKQIKRLIREASEPESVPETAESESPEFVGGHSEDANDDLPF